MTIRKRDVLIDSLEAWEKHAGPKSSVQWVDGRSAKEAARAWLEGEGLALPAEVAAAVDTHPAFGPVIRWEA